MSEPQIKKLVRDGKVAVLYSPDFGAGWYTWNTDIPELLFDPVIVEMVEHGTVADIVEYVRKTYNTDGRKVYPGGAKNLVVVWLEQGTQFRINEYDGSESIQFKENDEWITA